MADYYSFEDVMHELELNEDELKRMVSEGELRAFRDQNKMKFRREDVESMKKGRSTEPTMILPDQKSAAPDETVLDLDLGDVTPTRPAPMSPDEETVTTEETIPLDLEGAATEPVEILSESTETSATAPMEPVMADSPTTKAPRTTGSMRKTGKVTRRTAEIPYALEEEIERRRPHPVWTVFIFLALLGTLFSGLVVYDLMRMESHAARQPLSLTAGLAEWVLQKFWEDPNWRKFHERRYPEGGQKRPPFVDEKDPRVTHRSYDGPTFREPDEFMKEAAGEQPKAPVRE